MMQVSEEMLRESPIIAGHLPDLEGHDHNIRPHPDGHAWRKACPECAHRMSDPQHIGEAYQQRMMEFDGTAVFYCLHRQDGKFDRICACYAATNRLARLPQPPRHKEG
jgi:hypothetical protein